MQYLEHTYTKTKCFVSEIQIEMGIMVTLPQLPFCNMGIKITSTSPVSAST